MTKYAFSFVEESKGKISTYHENGAERPEQTDLDSSLKDLSSPQISSSQTSPTKHLRYMNDMSRRVASNDSEHRSSQNNNSSVRRSQQVQSSEFGGLSIKHAIFDTNMGKKSLNQKYNDSKR